MGYKIVGMRIQKSVGLSFIFNENERTFDKNFIEFPKYILCVEDHLENKYEIKLYKKEAMCPSGYTTASYGIMKIKKVKKHYFNWTPKKDNLDMYADFPFENFKWAYKNTPTFKVEDLKDNTVFSVSKFGKDKYYPTGDIFVNMDMFEKTIRHKEDRPVWIFKGASNVGKSFLADKLKGLSVYETDSSENLPEIITTDVVVLGNKYSFDLDTIKSKLFGHPEIHVVSFD